VENDKLNQLKLAYRKEKLRTPLDVDALLISRRSCFLLFPFFDKLGILVSRLLTTKNKPL
jgi:hypothetical protein